MTHYLVPAIHRQLREERGPATPRPTSPSSLGGCPRQMYFRAIGMEPTHPLEPEQLVTFRRGDAVEELLRPLVQAADGVELLPHPGVCEQCHRDGHHVIVATPAGRDKPGHIDDIIVQPRLEVLDYKSVTPGGYEWRARNGADRKNVAQVNAYCHGIAQHGLDALDGPSGDLHWRLLYLDIAGGRLMEFAGEYDAERAESDLALLDMVDEAVESWSETAAAPGRDPANFAPPCSSDDPDSFPSSYTKDGKIFRCPYWGLGCGGCDENEEPDGGSGPIELDDSLDQLAEQYEALRRQEGAVRAKRKEIKAILVNALKHAKTTSGRTEHYSVKRVRVERTGGIDKDKIPADILATAKKPDTVYYRLAVDRLINGNEEDL